MIWLKLTLVFVIPVSFYYYLFIKGNDFFLLQLFLDEDGFLTNHLSCNNLKCTLLQEINQAKGLRLKG